MSNSSTSNHSELNILLLIVKYWKTFLIVGIVSAVVSFTLSTPYFIKPKFKSSVIMFSTSSNAVSQLILAEGNYNEFLDVTQFGDDEHIEQMIQILNSREIKDHMIAKFNLIDHYDIDTTKKYWKTKLYKFVKNNIQFSRTDNLAVEITVEDTDPVLAADMANEIADYYDILKREIVQQRSKEAFAILQEEMKLTDQLIMELNDSLSRIMSKGIYDYETQSERLMQQYAIELAKGNTVAVKRIKDELMILEQYGPLYVSVRDRLFYLKDAQKLFQEKYQNTRVDASYSLPQKFIVEKAVPADKKSYPKKMLITIVSTFCVLLFTLFLLIFKENINSGLHAIGQQLRHKA
ncbi:MAG: hypothetical protein WCZ21_00185 [Bacteroidales bacterium]